MSGGFESVLLFLKKHGVTITHHLRKKFLRTPVLKTAINQSKHKIANLQASPSMDNASQSIAIALTKQENPPLPRPGECNWLGDKHKFISK